jgi:hypothetical protein
MDMTAYCNHLTEACDRYERTSPTVHAHCDDLYIRINEDPQAVTLAELQGVAGLWADGWLGKHYATNMIYHLRHRLGMDVTGHAGF